MEYTEKSSASCMDYEDEYYRLKDRYDALSCKNTLMHGDFETIRRENELLKAKLDMVYLFLGVNKRVE